jgi:hypothetical protein
MAAIGSADCPATPSAAASGRGVDHDRQALEGR